MIITTVIECRIDTMFSQLNMKKRKCVYVIRSIIIHSNDD